MKQTVLSARIVHGCPELVPIQVKDRAWGLVCEAPNRIGFDEWAFERACRSLGKRPDAKVALKVDYERVFDLACLLGLAQPELPVPLSQCVIIGWLGAAEPLQFGAGLTLVARLVAREGYTLVCSENDARQVADLCDVLAVTSYEGEIRTSRVEPTKPARAFQPLCGFLGVAGEAVAQALADQRRRCLLQTGPDHRIARVFAQRTHQYLDLTDEQRIEVRDNHSLHARDLHTLQEVPLTEITEASEAQVACAKHGVALIFAATWTPTGLAALMERLQCPVVILVVGPEVPDTHVQELQALVDITIQTPCYQRPRSGE